MNLPDTSGNTGAVATAQDMQAMAGLARPEEQADNRVPILKLNYDPDSKYELGTWVLGQKKDDEGKISDEGELVSKVVVIAVQRRLHFFNKDNPSKSVNTELVPLADFPSDRDAFNAKVEELQAAGAKGDAKWQIIVCAMALVGGELKDCVMRMTGTAKFAMEEYLTQMVKWTDEASGQRFTVPFFTFVTHMGESERRKNGTTIYWVPSFERGVAMTSQQHQDFFVKKRSAAFVYFNILNSSMESQGAAASPAPAAEPNQQWQPPAGTEDDVPFSEPAQVEFVSDVPAGAKQVVHGANKETEAPAAEEYDIEAAINGALAANG